MQSYWRLRTYSTPPQTCCQSIRLLVQLFKSKRVIPKDNGNVFGALDDLILKELVDQRVAGYFLCTTTVVHGFVPFLGDLPPLRCGQNRVVVYLLRGIGGDVPQKRFKVSQHTHHRRLVE